MIEANDVLFATLDVPEARQEARDYMSDKGFTTQDLRAIIHDGLFLLVAKECMEWPQK